MKKILLLLWLAGSNFLFAQEKMYIHTAAKISLGVPVSSIDSIYFTSNGAITNFRMTDTLAQFQTAEIDSLTFGGVSDTISIRYSENETYILNPLAFEGVSINVNQADVTITSSMDAQDIHYTLSGATSNGMFKIYSNKRCYLHLKGVQITNPDGPAINIQSQKKTMVILTDGTVNTLSDGTIYASPALNSSGEEEDQKAAFFSEAKLSFSGTGSLSVYGNGTDKHAICSDDLIQVEEGNITIQSSMKDGIHGRDGVEIAGGTLQINALGDAIDGDEGYVKITGGEITASVSSANANGISCDSILLVSGGIIDITVLGNQSKGIKSTQNMTLSGGNIHIHNTGDAVLIAAGSGYNPSYCTAIKCNANMVLSGANITITGSGKASKSISSDMDIEITGGTINITNSGIGTKYINSVGAADAYVATCLSADGNITILNGSLTTISSGSAGKGISAEGTLQIGDETNSPIINITTTGTKVLVSGSGPSANYAEAKAIKCNGAISILNGTTTIASADDGIKSETSVSLQTGTINVINSTEGMEAPAITINSGNISLKSSDDSFNATHGSGGEGNDGSMLLINGGNVVVNTTSGDGLDSNGNITINGGTVIAHGPQSSPEVGMDFNGTCNMNGGVLVISGTNSFMTQAPNTSSSQRSVYVKSNASIPASTLFHVQDAAGNNILTFQGVRSYYSIIFSSSGLTAGSTYSIYTGGTCTGTSNNGLFPADAAYSGGTFKKNFTINGIVTNVTL